MHLWQPPHLLALLRVATGFFWMTTIEHSQEAGRWQWKSIRTRREDFDAVMLPLLCGGRCWCALLLRLLRLLLRVWVCAHDAGGDWCRVARHC